MKERSQLWVLIGLSSAVGGLTGVLYFHDRTIFQPFIAGINPFFASLAILLSGITLLTFLLSRGWSFITKKVTLKLLYRYSGLAGFLAGIMILVDLGVVFPADLNVPFPESVLFYPVIGYYAEILFHIMPLTLLIIVVPRILRNLDRKYIIGMSIITVSLIEPVYQSLTGLSTRLPLWAAVYMGLHVYAINLIQLYIFKRYDFISMYGFRLVYYLCWHIGWGYARLKVLY